MLDPEPRSLFAHCWQVWDLGRGLAKGSLPCASSCNALTMSLDGSLIASGTLWESDAVDQLLMLPCKPFTALTDSLGAQTARQTAHA